ncbi:MAG: ferric reductase-like transmembrane domain-containing protein [bacterium]|nr:ferric reductase-like transmembrane domain-containing protein [bacterium]
MVFLIHNSRRIVYLFSALTALTIFFLVRELFPSSSQQTTRLVQSYAFTAVIYIYFALLASPIYNVFPSLPYKPLYLTARKAIGVSAFFFALLHVSFALFGPLGGFHLTSFSQLNFHFSPSLEGFLALYFLPISLFFPGIALLSERYQIALVFSSIAFVILSLMALTSLEYFVIKLGRKWKILHRFVYLAALAIVIHALLIGSHFTNLNGTVPWVSFLALAFLLVLETIRFYKFLVKKSLLKKMSQK